MEQSFVETEPSPQHYYPNASLKFLALEIFLFFLKTDTLKVSGDFVTKLFRRCKVSSRIPRFLKKANGGLVVQDHQSTISTARCRKPSR